MRLEKEQETLREQLVIAEGGLADRDNRIASLQSSNSTAQSEEGKLRASMTLPRNTQHTQYSETGSPMISPLSTAFIPASHGDFSPSEVPPAALVAPFDAYSSDLHALADTVEALHAQINQKNSELEDKIIEIEEKNTIIDGKNIEIEDKDGELSKLSRSFEGKRQSGKSEKSANMKLKAEILELDTLVQSSRDELNEKKGELQKLAQIVVDYQRRESVGAKRFQEVVGQLEAQDALLDERNSDLKVSAILYGFPPARTNLSSLAVLNGQTGLTYLNFCRWRFALAAV